MSGALCTIHFVLFKLQNNQFPPFAFRPVIDAACIYLDYANVWFLCFVLDHRLRYRHTSTCFYLIVSLKPEVWPLLSGSVWLILFCNGQWSLMDHLGEPGMCLAWLLQQPTVAAAMVMSEGIADWSYESVKLTPGSVWQIILQHTSDSHSHFHWTQYSIVWEYGCITICRRSSSSAPLL